MAILRYDETNGAYLVNDAGTVNASTTKPALSFAYDRLAYNVGASYRVLQGVTLALTVDQCAECESYANANVSSAAAPAGETLAQLQARLCNDIDLRAGQIRQKYITSVPGQDATYQAKLAEANSYIAAGSPADASSYPYINNEAQQKNAAPATIANLYISTNNQWTSINAPIEGIRTAGKDNVNNATTAAGAQTAHDNAITSLNTYA